MTTTAPAAVRVVNVEKLPVQLQPGDIVMRHFPARGEAPAYTLAVRVEIVAVKQPGTWSVEYSIDEDGFAPTYGYFLAGGQEQLQTVQVVTA